MKRGRRHRAKGLGGIVFFSSLRGIEAVCSDAYQRHRVLLIRVIAGTFLIVFAMQTHRKSSWTGGSLGVLGVVEDWKRDIVADKKAARQYISEALVRERVIRKLIGSSNSLWVGDLCFHSPICVMSLFKDSGPVLNKDNRVGIWVLR